MSNTAIFVLYEKGKETIPNCILDFKALDDMLNKKLKLPVKHGAELLGYVTRLKKKGNKIYAIVKLENDIAYSMQQLGKKSAKDKVIITDAKLFELYI